MWLFGSKREFGEFSPFEGTITVDIKTENFGFIATIETSPTIGITNSYWPAIVCSQACVPKRQLNGNSFEEAVYLW